MLVIKLVARSPNVTTTMEGKVKRLLGRRDQSVYLTWMEQKEKDQKYTPTTNTRTATGIQQGTVRRTPETGKSGPYGGRVGYRTVKGPDNYWQSNNHEIPGSDQQNTGK